MAGECAQDHLQDPQGLALRRTKLVFLYSSDDDDGIPSATERGSFAVEEAPVLNPPEEELRAMQAEANNAAAARHGELADDVPLPPPPLFVEDTVGVPHALGPAITRNRVKVVEVPPLHKHCTLRRHLNLEEAERLAQSRKRFFQDEEEEGGEEDVSNGVGRGGHREKTVSEKEGDLEESECPRPILNSDGFVTAVAVGGYKLTVDEQQLQEDEEEEEEEEGWEGKGEVTWADDADEDYEDEEEDELDDAIVAAIVEQLVRCCESDELDEALREDGRRFLERATPLLKRLHAEEIELTAFGEEMRADIMRLQRAYQRVSRPKDSPIVIDGVVMDM